MPNSMIGSESHLYNCNQSIGPLIDTGLVGGLNTNFFNGTPGFDAAAGIVSLDGVTAQLGFTTDVGVSPWIWTDVGGCAGYIKWINRITSVKQNGNLVSMFSPETIGGFDSGPLVFWDDNNTVNAIRIGLSSIDSSYHKTLALGREMNEEEVFVILWSYNPATNAYVYVLKSSDEVDPIDLNASGTGTNDLEDDAKWVMGGNEPLTNMAKIGVDQFGSVIGSQFTLSELQADADSLLLGGSDNLTTRLITLLSSVS